MSKGEIPIFCDTFVAGANLLGLEHKAVKLNAAGAVVLCGAGESSIGILQIGEDTGHAVSVMELGNALAHLGAAVANAGVNLTPDANAELVTAGGGDAVVAYSLKSGAHNEIVPVCLTLKSSSGTTGMANAYLSFQFPVLLSSADNCDLVTDFVPGVAGTIESIQYVAQVVASTPNKTADISLEIEAVGVTGGVVSLTTAGCTPIGKVTAGTAITGTNTITAASKISVLAANTGTPFIEGSGYIVILVKI